ncbi:phosphoribosyltransferase family protein [Nocardioides dilutus]
MTMFSNRSDAGRQLVAGLTHLAGEPVVVLGLPRGGVPVAFEIARALKAPLDVIVVRKLGVPWQPELAMGAIGEEGVRVLDRRVIAAAGLSEAALRTVEQRERAELEARVERLRGARARVPLTGRVAVVVDDGIATGSTAHAACEVARRLGATRVVLASPVAPAGTTAEELAADELVCCAMPLGFQAVGNYYRDFSPTTDQEVVALLGAAPVVAPEDRALDEEVEISLRGGVVLRGHLHLPARARGVVVFAHGSGSSRLSPRNRAVAHRLQAAGLGTLLVDLLTPHEEADPHNVFDIPLLGSRLTEVGRWVLARPEAESCALGYFGASTGAGAALWAAAEPDSPAAAVVSRGGRPDLAGDRLPWVTAPTLLIVGGADPVVLDLNRQAQTRMRCLTRLVVVPGATHLFEEPGTLDEVARLAATWFGAHLLDGADSAERHPVERHGVP